MAERPGRQAPPTEAVADSLAPAPHQTAAGRGEKKATGRAVRDCPTRSRVRCPPRPAETRGASQGPVFSSRRARAIPCCALRRRSSSGCMTSRLAYRNNTYRNRSSCPIPRTPDVCALWHDLSAKTTLIRHDVRPTGSPRAPRFLPFRQRHLVSVAAAAPLPERAQTRAPSTARYFRVEIPYNSGQFHLPRVSSMFVEFETAVQRCGSQPRLAVPPPLGRV